MASNLLEMASNPIAMASNLLAIGLQPDFVHSVVTAVMF